jgi:hypothetical protein
MNFAYLLYLTGFQLGVCLAATQLSVSYTFTGSAQSFTVPDGVTKLSINLCGASGGGGYGIGGYGLCLTYPEAPVIPGQLLYIFLGGINGYNGGGKASGSGFSGGGASDIRTNFTDLSSRLIVAGGGGGAGYNGQYYNKGGSANYSSGSGSGAGYLASMSAGGAGGKYSTYPNGSAGVFGYGGNSAANGGGGGGGWYGGGKVSWMFGLLLRFLIRRRNECWWRWRKF